MSLSVKPDSGPINREAFLAGLFGSAAWWFSDASNAIVQVVATGICCLVAIPTAVEVGALLVKDYRLRRKLAKAAAISTDHGTAREATWEEIVERGMHDPASGNFIGLFEGKYPIFTPPKTPFTICEMPPGAGKTKNLVVKSILHQARLGKSLFIPDVKTELAPMLVKSLRKLGFEVWCINPAKAHKDICGDTEINLYQSVLDACLDQGSFRLDASKLAHDLADLHLPEPAGAQDKNIYFRNGSRRCLSIAILSLALLDPSHCTPSDVFALLNDPKRFRKLLLKLRHEITKLMPEDGIAEFLKTEAANLLDRFEHNEENAAAFLEGATQSLITFNQAGRMAGYGLTATHNIADMRKRQVIVFVMTPLSHSRDFAPVISLLNHTLLEICKRDPAGHPVHIVGEEALNYRFSNLRSDMETMRGLKMSADFYIQSYQGLVAKYGRETASAISAYSDVSIYAGLNSDERCRHVTDLLAEATIRKQDYSFKAEATEISVASREQGRRLMTPDEVRAMPRDDAWVFVRGMRPTRVKMIDYGRADPWRDEVDLNPLEGSKLYGSPLFGISYPDSKHGPNDGPIVKGVRYPRLRNAREKKTSQLVWPIQLRHLLWMPPLLALLSMAFVEFSTPHLRMASEYSNGGDNPYYQRCDYVGLHSRRIFPDNGHCPLVAFLPSN